MMCGDCTVGKRPFRGNDDREAATGAIALDRTRLRLTSRRFSRPGFAAAAQPHPVSRVCQASTSRISGGRLAWPRSDHPPTESVPRERQGTHHEFRPPNWWPAAR